LLLLVYGLGILAILAARAPSQQPGSAERGARTAQPAAADATPPPMLTFRGEAMSTTVAVTLPASPRAESDAAAVLALFRDLEVQLSEWRPGTPLARVNAAAGGDAVRVPPALLAVVRRGVELGAATDGAFDPSWAALWGLWDFRAQRPRVPSADEVARRAALVDYRQVELDEAAGTLRLPRAGMKIGLGGIAKGYALDRAGELLVRRGVRDFLLVAGGQVLARGSRGGRPWQVGVRDPRGAAGDWFAVLSPGAGSVSTSGDYESWFESGGERYHHILDPHTGWPGRGLRSATVVCAEATLADALSTALMVLGPQRGLATARRLGVEALLVDEEGRVLTTPGLAALRLRHPPRAG
jgi:thiamine biosynthesis lipoprotein